MPSWEQKIKGVRKYENVLIRMKLSFVRRVGGGWEDRKQNLQFVWSCHVRNAVTERESQRDQSDNVVLWTLKVLCTRHKDTSTNMLIRIYMSEDIKHGEWGRLGEWGLMLMLFGQIYEVWSKSIETKALNCF